MKFDIKDIELGDKVFIKFPREYKWAIVSEIMKDSACTWLKVKMLFRRKYVYCEVDLSLVIDICKKHFAKQLSIARRQLIQACEG